MNALFVVGSRPTLTGTIYDFTAGARQAKDLSGAAVVIKASIGGAAVKSWPATPDPDQVTNRGKFQYAMDAVDIDAVGTVELQAWVTIGGKTIKSAIVVRHAQRSVA